MAEHSLTQYLALTQEQIKAFVLFKKIGSKLFDKYSDSLVRQERWGWACYELIIISEDYVYYSGGNFLLNEKQIQSLRDLLELADELKKDYSKQSPDSDSKEEKQLYEKIVTSLAVFRNAVERTIKEAMEGGKD